MKLDEKRLEYIVQNVLENIKRETFSIGNASEAGFQLKGPYAALLTPFNQEGTVNEGTLRRQVQFLLNSRITGLFPCGTTGEFVHLTPEENMRVMEIVAEEAAGKMQVVPGVSSSNKDTTITLMRKAKGLGCPAAVICPPYYITLEQKDILAYYKKLIASVDIPIVLYNIPMFTNEISLEVFTELLKEKNVIAIKDSSGNMKRIMHYIDIVKRVRPNFSVMTGTDDMLFPALMGGCVGSMTALSGILPEINTGIYKAYYEKNYERARELQYKTLRILSYAESISFPAGYKIIMEKRGFKMGLSKQVVAEMGTEKYTEIEKAIELELKNILGNRVKVA